MVIRAKGMREISQEAIAPATQIDPAALMKLKGHPDFGDDSCLGDARLTIRPNGD